MDRPTDSRPIDASFPFETIEAFVAATVTAFQELTGTEVVAYDPFLLNRQSAPRATRANDIIVSVDHA